MSQWSPVTPLTNRGLPNRVRQWQPRLGPHVIATRSERLIAAIRSTLAWLWPLLPLSQATEYKTRSIASSDYPRSTCFYHLTPTMAIHPSVRSEHTTSLTQQQAIDISAWTEQAAASLQVLDISDSVAEIEFPISSSNAATAVRGTSNTLSIPLDGPIVKSSTPRVTIVRSSGEENVSTVPSNVYRRREPLRRDSMKGREALLKGKEGSRRRQRWENGALSKNLQTRSISMMYFETNSSTLLGRSSSEQPLGPTASPQRLGRSADASATRPSSVLPSSTLG